MSSSPDPRKKLSQALDGIAGELKAASAIMHTLDFEREICKHLLPLFELSPYLALDAHKTARQNGDASLLPLLKDRAGSSMASNIYAFYCTGINLPDLHDITDKPVWRRFCQLTSEMADTGGSLALVFPIRYKKQWVIHNMSLAAVQGRARMVIPSEQEGVPYVQIVPLELFCEEYRKVRV